MALKTLATIVPATATTPAFTDDDQEVAFQTWYADHAKRLGLAPSPDDPAHGYDFRNAFLEGYEPDDAGNWDYRASTAFAKTAGTNKVDRTPARGAPATGASSAPISPTADNPDRITNSQTVPLTDAQRKDALARLDNIESRIGTYQGAIDAYTNGYVTPSEMDGYRKLGGTVDDYARRVTAHGRAFAKGLSMGEAQSQAFFDTGFLASVSMGLKRGLGEAGLGVARLGAMSISALQTQLPADWADKALTDTKAKFDSEFLGLPDNPIERAGYESAFPWVGKLLGDVGAFAAVASVTGMAGEVAGVPRILQAARGARGLVAINAAGAVGGAVIGAALAPDDERGRAAVEGAAIGLGGTAMLSSLLAGRPIGTPARLLKLQAMAETFEAESLGGALRVAPRLTFGRMAMSGIEGAGYSTLTAMGRGEPVDKAIGTGVEEGLMFAGYDTAFIGLGRMARWLPTHQKIGQTWAKTAEALKIPGRMASAMGTIGQGAPLAAIGEVIGGPVGAAIGGTIGAAQAAKLQAELMTTAARLRNVGLPEETVGKILSGAWTKMSAEEAESVTKALTKDVVERATADITDPVLKYAINESMGADAILDNTELRALSLERGRVTQAITGMRSQGILEIDPQMIQATKRLAELAERRSQVLLEEANALGNVAPGEYIARNIIDEAGRPAEFATGKIESPAADRLGASVRASGERTSFRNNSTITRDLADATLERNGIDLAITHDGARSLDLMMTPRERASAGITVAPAGVRGVKAPRFNLNDVPLPPGERMLADAAATRRTIESAPRAADRPTPFLERRSFPEQRKMIAETVGGWKRDGLTFNAAYDRAATMKSTGEITGAQESAFYRELDAAYGTRIAPAADVAPSSSAAESAAETDLARRLSEQRASRPALPRHDDAARATIEGGYTFKPAGEIARKDKPPIRYFTSNKDMPDGGGKAGSRTTEEVIRRNGLDPFAGMSGESGAVRGGLLGPLGAGAIGALVAPAIARRLGMIDEDDSVLTASAIGFAVAAGLGYKIMSREGVALDAAATRMAKFTKPLVEESIPAADIARVTGKTGDRFKVMVDGKQIGGRRLYWALPQDAQINHTVNTMDAWPQRTTQAGEPMTLPDRRAGFERDLKRFAPFTVTDGDWQRITDSFMASTKALGYTPADQMRLYKGWLGWMTTPLEQRGRTDITHMSLDRLGRDATNPFTTAAGIDELRARALMADTITGPSMPLPRWYKAASNSINKDGTPMAGRIRDLADDIEANPPSSQEGTADTLTPWWSAPGARGIAPTVRMYRYADRIAQGGNARVGGLIRNVTQGIFEATSLVRGADDKDRAAIASIFRGITGPDDMALLDRAVQSPEVRDAIKGTNPRVFEAAVATRKFLKDKGDQLGLDEFERIQDYLPWVYNYRTKRELAELARKGVAPTDINYPIDAPVPRHVYFNHLESRTANSPLGQRVSPLEALQMYAHGANRKVYMDQLLANFGPDTFREIRSTQPWLAHDLGRWLLDVVGVPGPGTMYAQKKVESVGLFLERYPMFQRPGLAQEINERYFLSPGGANNLSRLATGWAYTSKIAWNLLSSITNLSQQIINGGTEYGLINVLTSSVIGAGVAGSERMPVLAPIFDAITPKGREYRKLLTERGILSETSQRHFDSIAQYEAIHGTNRAHLALSGGIAGAAAGATATMAINTDRSNDDQLSVAAGAAVGATVATVGAAKSAIMRRALMRVRDIGTFPFNLAETWNRSTIGIAGIREARSAQRALTSPVYAATRRAQERVEGIFTGALGGAALANVTGSDPTTGALLGGAAAGLASGHGESRTARTQRQLAAIRGSAPIFESRVIRDQAKDGLRALTDDEVAGMYAQTQTDVTQFRIAKEGRGYQLNTPHGQALGALQSYTINQAEFVGGRLMSFLDTANRAIKGEPVAVDFRVFRYASYLLGVGSVYGAILGGSHDGESDPDYWVSRLGLGVMPMVQWNDTARRWEVKPVTDLFGGPLLGDITRTANSYMKLLQDEDANASFTDTSDKLVEQLFPGARSIKRSREKREGDALLKLMQEGAAEAMSGPQPMGATPQPGR